MNAIEVWRRRKGYTVEEAAQALDTTPEAYSLIESGVALAKLHGRRAVELEIGSPYSILKRETKCLKH